MMNKGFQRYITKKAQDLRAAAETFKHHFVSGVRPLSLLLAILHLRLENDAVRRRVSLVRIWLKVYLNISIFVVQLMGGLETTMLW